MKPGGMEPEARPNEDRRDRANQDPLPPGRHPRILLEPRPAAPDRFPRNHDRPDRECRTLPPSAPHARTGAASARRDRCVADRYHRHVDALEQNDVERSGATPPEVKLAQALDMMAAGMRLQRAKLEREHPDASPQELERMFVEWLRRED